jgi:hypothetical protein
VNDRTGPAYAPYVFAQEGQAKAARVKRSALAEAMRRLFAANRIHIETCGPPSKLRLQLVPATGERYKNELPSALPPRTFRNKSTDGSKFEKPAWHGHKYASIGPSIGFPLVPPIPHARART